MIDSIESIIYNIERYGDARAGYPERRTETSKYECERDAFYLRGMIRDAIANLILLNVQNEREWCACHVEQYHNRDGQSAASVIRARYKLTPLTGLDIAPEQRASVAISAAGQLAERPSK